MLSKLYRAVRRLLHWLNIHWYTNMDVGSNDPYEHCEFCKHSRRMRDRCDKGKHAWIKFGEENGCTYLVTEHFVCLSCGRKAKSERYFG